MCLALSSSQQLIFLKAQVFKWNGIELNEMVLRCQQILWTSKLQTSRCVVLKNVTRYYRGTTTKNLRMHKEDDTHFRAWNTNVERKVDWTPFHSTKGVWTLPSHDTAHSDDQTKVNIEADAC